MTIPNALSASRIVFLPILALFFMMEWMVWFLGGYILLGLTDFADGYLARKLGQTSDFGKVLDSTADSFLLVSSGILLGLLFPERFLANMAWLPVVLSIVVLSFAVSLVKYRKLVQLHTLLLKCGAFLVYSLTVASFLFDTTLFIRFIIFYFIVAMSETVLIFLLCDEVDPDVRSVLTVLRMKQNS